MNEFTFTYPTKVYFGEGVAKKVLGPELDKIGKKVMLAYGGGSVKANGIYDEIRGILEEAGKEVVDFSGIMSNPTYAKVQEGAQICGRRSLAGNRERRSPRRWCYLAMAEEEGGSCWEG